MFEKLTRKIRNITPTMWVILVVLAYFIFHFINGSRGLLSYFAVNSEIEQQKIVLEGLKTEADTLENKVNLMRDGSVDPDMLEEQAKGLVKMYGTDEYVLVSE